MMYPSVIAVVLVLSRLSFSEAEDCQAVVDRCMLSESCSPALYYYHGYCYSLLHGHTTQCRADCLKPIARMLTLESGLGEKYFKCSCSGAGKHLCQLAQKRATPCINKVRKVINNSKGNSSVSQCSKVILKCDNDDVCTLALLAVKMKCLKYALPNNVCSLQCEKAFRVLHKASESAFETCLCNNGDDNNDFACNKLKLAAKNCS